jgi:putative transposase
MAGEGHSIERSCRITGVSPNGFHMWRNRAPSERSIRHAWLLDQIVEVHAASRGTYGARRVHAELTMGRGIKVGHNAIEMLMSRAQIYGLPGPRRRKKVPKVITASDLVDREFGRPEPDRLWVTDITVHPTPWIPSVVATGLDHCDVRRASSRSVGVSQSSDLRGRLLSSAATASRSPRVCAARSVPFGKYWRRSPLVFSFVPRCQGLPASQK